VVVHPGRPRSGSHHLVDSLDAYGDKITGYTEAKVGEPLSNFNSESFSFV